MRPRTNKVIGKCYICNNPLRASQPKERFYDAGMTRLGHVECVETYASGGRMVEVLRKELKAEVIEEPPSIVEYLRGRKK